MKKTTVVVASVVLIVFLLVLGRLYFTEADFSLENQDWNGISALSSVADVRPLYDMSALSSVDGADTLLVVSPTQNYSAEESAYVKSFIGRGGRVIVMDDYGMANSLLYNINAPITLRQVPLCQDVDYYLKPSLPVISNITPSWETVNVSSLTFNHPVSLNVSGDAQVIASTSNLGWLDTNDNSVLDNDERMGVFPVIASWSNGHGELLVIGDPDIMANSVIGQTDNRIFLHNVFKGVVWVDVSHGRGVTPLAAIYYSIKNSAAVQLLVVLLVLACGLVYIKRRTIMGIIQRPAGKDKGRNGRGE